MGFKITQFFHLMISGVFLATGSSEHGRQRQSGLGLGLSIGSKRKMLVLRNIKQFNYIFLFYPKVSLCGI